MVRSMNQVLTGDDQLQASIDRDLWTSMFAQSMFTERDTDLDRQRFMARSFDLAVTSDRNLSACDCRYGLACFRQLTATVGSSATISRSHWSH